MCINCQAVFEYSDGLQMDGQGNVEAACTLELEV